MIAGFAEAGGDQLPSLVTIIRVIDPESPLANIVESLVAQAHSSREIEPSDVVDATDDAEWEIDQLIETVPEGDWFIPENAVLWRRWDDARDFWRRSGRLAAN